MTTADRSEEAFSRDCAGPASVDAFQHPMVVAALARMASSGSWARVLRGEPLRSRLDRADADLLVAAGVLVRRGVGFAVTRLDGLLSDPERLARSMTAQLQRALAHARGGPTGWTGEDLELVRNQGRSSAGIGDAIADGLVPVLPGVADRLSRGKGRFLDVGTGLGAVSARMCERFAGLTCVGLDVLPHVLDMARAELASQGLLDRVEVRNQSVGELAEVEEYDLAWVPQMFIPREQFVPGVFRVREALRGGGVIVVPTLAPELGEDAMQRALTEHAGHVLGGGPMARDDVRALLEEAGFAEVVEHELAGQVVLSGRRG